MTKDWEDDEVMYLVGAVAMLGLWLGAATLLGLGVSKAIGLRDRRG